MAKYPQPNVGLVFGRCWPFCADRVQADTVVASPHVPSNIAKAPAADAERVAIACLAPGVKSVVLNFVFMESPNVSLGLAPARVQGLTFDNMRTSFLLSRRSILPGQRTGLARLQDAPFVFLMRNAARAVEVFSPPATRVVEPGAQVTL